MSDPRLYLFARIKPKAEHLDDARRAVLDILPPTRAEQGCDLFTVHDGHGDGCLYLYEIWTDEAALAFHYDQPYTKAVFEKYQGWLAEEPQITKLTRID